MTNYITGGLAGIIILLAGVCIFFYNDNQNLNLKLQQSQSNFIEVSKALEHQNQIIKENAINVENYKKSLQSQIIENSKKPKKTTPNNCMGVLDYLDLD